jgi:hypothetical protein
MIGNDQSAWRLESRDLPSVVITVAIGVISTDPRIHG